MQWRYDTKPLVNPYMLSVSSSLLIFFACEQSSINITRFMRDELRLTPDDTVVVKMDIEEAEWGVLGGERCVWVCVCACVCV